MKKAMPLLVICFLAGCNDEMPLSPQAGPPRQGASMKSGPRDVDTRRNPPVGPFFLRPPDPKVQGPTITQSFDAVVLEKHKKVFLVEGTSGRKYLLIPDECFVTKPTSTLPNIKYEQLKVKDKVTVHLTAPIFPFPSAYICLSVDLHGVKLGEMDLTPRGIRADDLEVER